MGAPSFGGAMQVAKVVAVGCLANNDASKNYGASNNERNIPKLNTPTAGGKEPIGLRYPNFFTDITPIKPVCETVNRIFSESMSRPDFLAGVTLIANTARKTAGRLAKGAVCAGGVVAPLSLLTIANRFCIGITEKYGVPVPLFESATLIGGIIAFHEGYNSNKEPIKTGLTRGFSWGAVICAVVHNSRI